MPAETSVERGHEFDPLQRIETERRDRRFGRDVGKAGAGHRQRVLADGGERGGLRGRYRRCGTCLGAVRVERLELAGEEGGAAGVALDFAAARLGDRAAADQHHGVERQAVLFENRGPDGIDDRRQVTAAVALDLVHEHEALRAALVDRECGAKAGCEQRVTFARRGFDVLGMMVEPAHDDEVVDSAGDVELALVDEAEIAGAQERAVAVVTSPCVERGRGLSRVVPVTLADGFAGDPDLADSVGSGRRQGLCIDDGNGEANPTGAPHPTRRRACGAVSGSGSTRFCERASSLNARTAAPVPDLGPVTMSVASARP